MSIKLSQLLDEKELEKYVSRSSQKSPTVLGKLFSRKSSTDASVSTSDPVKQVKMTRSEYLSYWARDSEGKYVGTEPEEAGRAIWRRKLWAELYLPPPEKGLDVSGFTGGKSKPMDHGVSMESGMNWIGEK